MGSIDNRLAKCIPKNKSKMKENNKEFIRLDTVGENKGLIKHYQSCGFNFLGVFKLANTQGLPQHYHNASVSLFEIFLPAENEN